VNAKQSAVALALSNEGMGNCAFHFLNFPRETISPLLRLIATGGADAKSFPIVRSHGDYCLDLVAQSTEPQ